MSSRTRFDRSAGGGTDERARAGRVHPDARKRAARRRLIALTRLLDTAVEVPLLRTRAGLDALFGLVPGIGDVVSGALGLYLVFEARRLGASRWLQARMIGNLLVDSALGAVPLAGDLFDVYFKAHVRNLKLLQKELGEPFIDGAYRRDSEVIDAELVEERSARR
jgi:hypothetical protein